MIERYLHEPLSGMNVVGWIYLGIIVLCIIGYLIRACTKKKQSRAQICWSTFFLAYVAFIFLIAVFGRRQEDIKHFEWIPLWSWWESIVMIVEEGSWLLLEQIVMNFLMMIPVGFCLSRLWKVPMKKAIGFSVLMSGTIEILQVVLQVGLFEWDDILHNMLGCVAGVEIQQTIEKRNKKKRVKK